MKAIRNLFIAVMVLGSTATQALELSSVQKIYSASLNKFSLDPKSPLAHMSIQYGFINLNLSAGLIHLTLQPNTQCPIGKFCAAVMPAPIEINLPITDIETDSCGAVHYIAEPMLAAPALINVDRPVEALVVVDNTSNTCQTLLPLTATEVQYSTSNARGEETLSTFEGKKLNQGEKSGIHTMNVELK